MAQAALETGWGRSVIQDANGNSSHNLFNIKADHRWSGETVSKVTLEYKNGIAHKVKAPFRTYESYEDSFKDYVQFIHSSPRYADAVKAGDDSTKYLTELQKAGYATDPEYARKIDRVMSEIQHDYKG